MIRVYNHIIILFCTLMTYDKLVRILKHEQHYILTHAHEYPILCIAMVFKRSFNNNNNPQSTYKLR